MDPHEEEPERGSDEDTAEAETHEPARETEDQANPHGDQQRVVERGLTRMPPG